MEANPARNGLARFLMLSSSRRVTGFVWRMLGGPLRRLPLSTAANSLASSSALASQPSRKARGWQREPGDRGRCIQG